MRRTAAITGALLITAATLTACGGSTSSGDVPEIDAVAETWEEQGPQFRKDVCDDGSDGIDPLAEATLEANPNEFLDDDVKGAVYWFLRSGTNMPSLPLDRGIYWNADYIAAQQAEADANMSTDWDQEAWAKEYTEDDLDSTYLGLLDPVPDPCAD